jgi:2-iminobutanoate/2-iminopropanoate deaminase
LAEAEIRRVAVQGLATASPFSHVVIDGSYAFLSGIVASDVPGGAAAQGDFAREAEIVMTAIRGALAEIGLGMGHIVRVEVHLTDIGRMPEFDRVYARFFPGDALPARTCTQSGGLAGGSNLEITVTARL